MKKINSFLIAMMISCAAVADTEKVQHNPMFGLHDAQFNFSTGIGVDSGQIVPPPAKFVPFSLFQFGYSVPNTFFSLPARQSINVAMTVGYAEKYGWDWPEYSIPMIYVAEDFLLAWGEKWYFGSGAGIGMQAEENERFGTKLLFQFKIFGGYQISENYNIEAFAIHMSNGSTDINNHSYAFYGAGFTYNF